MNLWKCVNEMFNWIKTSEYSPPILWWGEKRIWDCNLMSESRENIENEFESCEDNATHSSSKSEKYSNPILISDNSHSLNLFEWKGKFSVARWENNDELLLLEENTNKWIELNLIHRHCFQLVSHLISHLVYFVVFFFCFYTFNIGTLLISSTAPQLHLLTLMKIYICRKILTCLR